jgi:hypothetical protein
MGEYAKAEPLIQEALRKALALVAPSVRRAGVGECLSLRSTLNRGPAADLPPSARLGPRAQTSALIPPVLFCFE